MRGKTTHCVSEFLARHFLWCLIKYHVTQEWDPVLFQILHRMKWVWKAWLTLSTPCVETDPCNTQICISQSWSVSLFLPVTSWENKIKDGDKPLSRHSSSAWCPLNSLTIHTLLEADILDSFINTTSKTFSVSTFKFADFYKLEPKYWMVIMTAYFATNSWIVLMTSLPPHPGLITNCWPAVNLGSVNTGAPRLFRMPNLELISFQVIAINLTNWTANCPNRMQSHYK